jgi:primary-amine oxidase
MFETIELKEPDKAALRSAETPPREARVNLFRLDAAGVLRLTVSLDAATVTSAEYRAGARPMIQLEQFLAIEGGGARIPISSPPARRGITDMTMVCVDPWSAGNFGVPGEAGRHLSHTFCWLRLRENENFYAHPIGGLNAVVDIKACKVIRVDDYGDIPIPMAEVNYEAQFRDIPRAAEAARRGAARGPSFALDGHVLTWDKLVFGGRLQRPRGHHPARDPL